MAILKQADVRDVILAARSVQQLPDHLYMAEARKLINRLAEVPLGVADARGQLINAEGEPLITVAQVCKELGFSVNTLYSRIRRGSFATPERLGIGNRLGWSRSAIDRWCAVNDYPNKRGLRAAG